jgi:hypothetical protein
MRTNASVTVIVPVPYCKVRASRGHPDHFAQCSSRARVVASLEKDERDKVHVIGGREPLYDRNNREDPMRSHRRNIKEIKKLAWLVD